MSERPDLDLDLSGIRVLVVDDNADAREILPALLRQTGALVSSVDSVRAALSVLSRDRPDAIVCDIAMPGESGYDLVRAVRRDAALRRIPVVAVTGYGRLFSRNRALAVGFRAFLEKPINLVAVCRTIRAVLRRRRATI
jgi:CheY-like chemotaxis protein